jgi:GIY-YIG catalytic domain-containing protein
MASPTGIVYIATNKANGKIYVGVTRRSFKRRISGHKLNAKLPIYAIAHIRGMRCLGMSFREIGVAFSVTPECIFYAAKRAAS